MHATVGATPMHTWSVLTELNGMQKEKEEIKAGGRLCSGNIEEDGRQRRGRGWVW